MGAGPPIDGAIQAGWNAALLDRAITANQQHYPQGKEKTMPRRDGARQTFTADGKTTYVEHGGSTPL